MKKIPAILSLFVIAVLVNSCKKDFSIYAPGAPITVVTGFLDASQDTQFVKINKTWQGDGNNLEYALVRDSSEYKWEDFNSITVKEIVGGQVVNSYPLAEIERHDKENGLFYGPDYTAYYFVKPDPFLAEATYRLEVDFKTAKDVWSETNVILPNANAIEKPKEIHTINFGSVSNNGDITYKDYAPRWLPYNNAGLYATSFDIHYKEMVWENLEHTVLISEEDKVIHWNVGTKQIEDKVGGKYQLKIPGETFYNLLASSMEVDPYISRQLGYDSEEINSDDVDVFDFSLSIANEIYRDFILVNEPSTTIVQERPLFTNIQNGLGVFASRVTITIENISLNTNSYNVIPWVPELAQLNICTPDILADITCE